MVITSTSLVDGYDVLLRAKRATAHKSTNTYVGRNSCARSAHLCALVFENM